MNTPWGKSDTTKRIAHGITLVGTPSHGGYKVSKERMLEIEKRFPIFTPFAGACWLEEDCDWAYLVVTFPEEWPAKHVAAAVESIRIGDTREPFQGEAKVFHVPDMEKNCQEAIKKATEFNERNKNGG